MIAVPQGAFTRLTAADGHSLDCWVEPARDPARGGLVIIQEIFGVTDQLRSVAAHYGEQGYKVAIPALYDRQQKSAVIPFDQALKGRNLMLGADEDAVLADLSAAVAEVADSGKVGVMGFCWGGGLAVRAGQMLDIAAAVSFYGTRLDQILDRPVKAPLQGHFGTEDSHTPPEVVDKLKAHVPGADIHLYRAGHAFANDQRPTAYDEAAATLAHERAAAFLARHLG